MLVWVKGADQGKRWKTGIFCQIWDNRETLILYLTVHPLNMICFYNLFAWYIANYLYFMEINISYWNSSAGQNGRSGERVKNG